MKKQFCIPACHQYIRNKDGSPNAQRIFSVTRSAYRAKYPEQSPADEELIAFLQANHIIPSDVKKEDLDMDHVELCFTIISQYKCNSICQLCAYSPLYKNQFEIQESILIGYALTSWNHLQSLISSGVTCRHFRAMIPVSEKSAVLVVPLNRLAFEYLEKVPRSQKDMLSVTDKIITSLKENNRDKLSAADLKIAKKYLDNLFHSHFQDIKPEEIHRILKECFQLSYQEADGICVSEQAVQKADIPCSESMADSGKKEEPKAACLEGFLTGKKPAAARNRNLQQEVPGKNHSATSPHTNPSDSGKATAAAFTENSSIPKRPLNTASAQAERSTVPDDSSASKISAITAEDGTNPSITAAVPGKANPSLLPIQKIKASYTQNGPDNPEIDKAENPLERKPIVWECPEDLLVQTASINLDSANPAQMTLFLNCLLKTPLLPVEAVNDQQRELILIYAGKQFFYYSKNNLTILDLMLPYLGKSRFRKILCYEPYELYSYFHQQRCSSVQIFSLRTAMDFTCPVHDWNSSPGFLLKQICGIEIPEKEADVMQIMTRYQVLYRKAADVLEKMTPEQKAAYQEKCNLVRLLGCSYRMDMYSAFAGRLFSKETRDGYIFSYTLLDEVHSPEGHVLRCAHGDTLPDKVHPPRKDTGSGIPQGSALKEILQPPYRAVCFRVRWNSKDCFPIVELLGKIAEYKVQERHDVFILAFHSRGAAFAVADSEYKYCCELVSRLACYLAEKYGKLPVYIDECLWGDTVES
nr:hypothetical protein [uncultured Schaedlerella sp.]